ncbi:DUF3105 domain-containing protein [Streptomyces sp. NBC_00102]|uniref:DUF3105 domain-containing protein n=1 Tax=Streptomyces sp. NBC_00102 TaxID=2975652 RepID=UPI00225A9635|nr:DUF3105 domain-containing protein [Streptomyces sp. NBC_00102]MCX5400990.1 DUF3105 domain-containing protein [Streptomyces sp. NBC_00102]
MTSTQNQNSPSSARRAKLEEARRKERGRERRVRILTISAAVVVVAALVAGGGYLMTKADDKDKAEAKAKTGAIAGERSWDKLTQNHVETPVSYPMNPPVGGDHNPVWMNCDADVYTEAIPKENAVHSMEHGAVWVTYNSKAADADVKALAERVKNTTYSLMSPLEDQADPLILSAWGKQVTVTSASDPRVAQFFTKYVQGAQTPEPGAACTGGISK